MISNYKLQELYFLALRHAVCPSDIVVELCRELAKARGITLYDMERQKNTTKRLSKRSVSCLSMTPTCSESTAERRRGSL